MKLFHTRKYTCNIFSEDVKAKPIKTEREITPIVVIK
jgi:hypothetical protein